MTWKESSGQEPLDAGAGRIVAPGDGKPVALGTDQEELARELRTTVVICPFGDGGDGPRNWTAFSYVMDLAQIEYCLDLQDIDGSRVNMITE